MLPQINDGLEWGFKIAEKTSNTYRIDFERKQTDGFIDGLEAVKQAVYCILNTERYQYIIYSRNYGIELQGLYGRPIPYVKSELKRRIKEALLQDSRIKEVDDFLFQYQHGRLNVSFAIKSMYGEIHAEKEVIY